MTANRFNFFIAIILLTAYAWLVFSWRDNASQHSLCIIKNVTGFACPSCGTTRATLLVAKGEIIEAIEVNPLGLVAAGFLLLAPLWLMNDFFRRKNSALLLFQKTEKIIQSNKMLSVVLAALIAANWMWNIHKGL